MLLPYTLPQLRQIEQKAEQAGIDLMQRAARSIADWVTQHYSQQDTILIAVGAGNNGGDALWAALNLDARDYHVILFIPQPVRSSAALNALTFCKVNHLLEINSLTQLTTRPNLIVDGLFGIGLNRFLSEDWQAIIQQLNNLNTPTLAIDTPSGLDAYTGEVYGATIKATATLTFLSDKPALHNDKGLALAGETIVDTLDLPKSLRP